jgi:hypothetical protein
MMTPVYSCDFATLELGILVIGAHGDEKLNNFCHLVMAMSQKKENLYLNTQPQCLVKPQRNVAQNVPLKKVFGAWVHV